MERDRVTDDGADGRGTGPVATAVASATTVELWTPGSPAGRETASVRRHLRRDESLQAVDGARLLGDRGGPAAVGLSDDRLLAVTEDGLVSVGLDRLTAVRSSVDATLGVRGRDARLLGLVGYLCSIVAFLGVLGTAADPLGRWGTTALAVGPFALVVHAVRNGDEFDGLEVVRRRRRTVTATFDDGTVLAIRTRPDSPLDRELAARVGNRSYRPARDGDD